MYTNPLEIKKNLNYLLLFQSLTDAAMQLILKKQINQL